MPWHYCESYVYAVMASAGSFAVTVVWIPLPKHFGYTIGYAAGSNRWKNILTSTEKQHSTETLMAFVSDFKLFSLSFSIK